MNKLATPVNRKSFFIKKTGKGNKNMSKLIETINYKGFLVQKGKKGINEKILDAIINAMRYVWFYSDLKLYICHITVKCQNQKKMVVNKSIQSILYNFRGEMKAKKIKCEFVWTKGMGANYHIMLIMSDIGAKGAIGIAGLLNNLTGKKQRTHIGKFQFRRPKKNEYKQCQKVNSNPENFNIAVTRFSFFACANNEWDLKRSSDYGHSTGYSKWVQSQVKLFGGIKYSLAGELNHYNFNKQNKDTDNV